MTGWSPTAACPASPGDARRRAGHAASCAEPGRAHLRLHPATRHPLLRRDAGQPGRLPRVDGALPAISAKLPALFTGIVGARRCISEPARCDLSRGIESDTRARTITVHLTAPDPDFLHKLTTPFAYVVPAGTPARAADKDFAPAGTGPYRIARWDSHRGGVLVRNPHFRPTATRPAGFPDRIEIKVSPLGRLETHTAAIDRGSADVTWLAGLPPARPAPGPRRARAGPAAQHSVARGLVDVPQRPAAAVRRPSRPPGDQLRHRPRRVGRVVRRSRGRRSDLPDRAARVRGLLALLPLLRRPRRAAAGGPRRTSSARAAWSPRPAGPARA